jgi:hypothetical protein
MTSGDNNRWALRDQYLLAIQYPWEQGYFPYSGRTYDSVEGVITSASERVRRYLHSERFDPQAILACTAQLRARLRQAGPDRFVDIPWPEAFLHARYGEHARTERMVIVTMTAKHRNRLTAPAVAAGG